MPKYLAEIKIETIYRAVIEADNENDAEELAYELPVEDLEFCSDSQFEVIDLNQI